MAKLNNKGFTIIEILASFIIVGAIVVSMFSVVMNYKNKQQVESIRNEIKTYKYSMTKMLEDDIIKYGVKSVSTTSNQMTITLNNNQTRILQVTAGTPSISYGTSGNIIKYPFTTEGMAIESYKLSASNNYLTIKIVFYHPDIGNQYGINIVSPYSSATFK